MESLSRPQPQRQRAPLTLPNAPSQPRFPEPAGAVTPRAADSATSSGARPLDRLLVRSEGRLLVVRLPEVDWIEGAGNYARIHAGARVFLYRQTLAALERRLDPTRFARIHRSTIVNLDRIEELRPTISGSYEVVLVGGKRLTLSRGHRRRALELVGPA